MVCYNKWLMLRRAIEILLISIPICIKICRKESSESSKCGKDCVTLSLTGGVEGGDPVLPKLHHNKIRFVENVMRKYQKVKWAI
jgi:hypothetical protein